MNRYRGSRRSPQKGDLAVIALEGNRYDGRLGLIIISGPGEKVDLIVSSPPMKSSRSLVVSSQHLKYVQSAQ